MLLKYSSLSMKPRIFRKLTGVSLNEFNLLCEKIRPEAKSLFKTTGRPPVLATLEDKLTLLFVYYRTYATHEFLGYFVGLDNSNVCRLFRKLEPIVARIIHIKNGPTCRPDE